MRKSPPKLVATQPEIAFCEWGQIFVRDPFKESNMLEFKDAIVWYQGAREWDWSKTGMHHVPGIRPDEVREFEKLNITHLVLSRGMHNQLRVTECIQIYARERGWEVFEGETPDAVTQFNCWSRRGYNVLGFFHTTC